MLSVVKKYAFLGLTGVLTLSGCAMTPYQENFSCEGTDDYGRCVSVTGAYEQAVTGVPQGTKIYKEGEDHNEDDYDAYDEDEDEFAWSDSRTKQKAPSVEGEKEVVTPYVDYRTTVYNKLSRMVREPATPMVKQPEIVRTLVMNYQVDTDGSPLFMHRYVYFFGDKPKWVMGEYQQVRKELVMPVIEVK